MTPYVRQPQPVTIASLRNRFPQGRALRAAMKPVATFDEASVGLQVRRQSAEVFSLRALQKISDAMLSPVEPPPGKSRQRATAMLTEIESEVRRIGRIVNIIRDEPECTEQADELAGLLGELLAQRDAINEMINPKE